MKQKVSSYMFACGYVETFERGRYNRATLSKEHNAFHLKGFIGGVHFWDSFDTLSEARKAFATRRKEIRKGQV